MKREYSVTVKLFFVMLMFMLFSGYQTNTASSDTQTSVKTTTDSAGKETVSNPDSSYSNFQILDYHVEPFILPVENFYIMNNRYPKNVEELLDSGLIYIWPAYPPTGEPMKLVPEVKPVKEDLGKIAYVYKSDDEASFQYVAYREHLKSYVVISLPTKQITEKRKAKYEKVKNDKISLPEKYFHEIMNPIYTATIHRDEYMRNGEVPKSIKETMANNFFWIKENMKPDFLTADDTKAIFYEWGVGELNGTPVSFYQFNLPYVSRDGLLRVSVYKDVSILKGWETLPEKDLDKVTNKMYIYSSRKLLDGTLDLPDEILITKAEILGK